MARKKIFYVISNISKSLAFEWTAEELKEEYDLTFFLLQETDTPLVAFLRSRQIKTQVMTYRGKRSMWSVFVRLWWKFLFLRPAAVHAHLFEASVVGMAAAWFAGIGQRVYTRHTSSYHHRYAPAGIKYDKLCNAFATHVVSISQATDQVLMQWEGVPAKKVVKIPHGFRFADLLNVSPARAEAVKKKWSITADRPCIGVIARHIEWKGIQHIIPAFAAFLRRYPDSLLVLANAGGPYHDTLREMTKNLPEGKVIWIPFEEDIAALYRAFDLYVHVPVDEVCEAFGQTYVEALAAGIPSIFTPSGIAREFIRDSHDALVVDFNNSEAIAAAMIRLWEDESLRHTLATNGKQSVISRFNLDRMIDGLKRLYG